MTVVPLRPRARGAVVGIDLGTTYSLVSILQDGRPLVLPNAIGDRLTASAVSFAGAWQHAAGQTRGISIDALKPSDR